jgi:hypothetical protein
MSRRRFSLGAAGFAVGVFAAGRFAVGAAQEATPGAGVRPLGYVSLRVRAMASPEVVPDVNKIVLAEFVPQVRALPGYLGYLLGNRIEQPNQSVTIAVFGTKAENDAFNETARTFVAGLDPKFAVETPTRVEGDLLITAPPAAASGTPSAATTPATPAASSPVLTSGYVAVRIHTSKPGTNPREFLPLAKSGFVPIVSTLPGFLGYLWFPFDGGFTAVSLFDSQEAALASTAAAKDWAAENLTAYTDGNPTVINANIVYADLPVLTAHSG